ncbi:MAG: MFS transporter [bacterium]|nr:MFS transporter [bacterium]
MRRVSIFESLRYRNFRLFWSGQLISLIGSWIQNVAQGWLVLELTNSSFLLGLVNSIGSLPVLFFSIIAGVIIDRIRKRNLIIITQTSLTLLAFILGFLVSTGLVKIWHVIIIVFLVGLVNAFDMPARQSFVIELVGRESLMNAIALNSSIFNAARMIGPAIAGIMVSSVGVAGCFYINAISFIPVIISLFLINGEFRIERREISNSLIEDLKLGLKYLGSNREVFLIIIMVAVNSVFGMPYTVFMPVFARDVFKVGARGLGFLMASVGIGALIGALFVASISKYRKKGRILFIGIFFFSAFLIVFSLSRSYILGLLILILTGFFMIIFTATANTLVQTYTRDDMRGRVMSIYTTFFAGMTPLGSLQAGTVSSLWGAPVAILLGGTVNLVMAITVFIKFSSIKNL